MGYKIDVVVQVSKLQRQKNTAAELEYVKTQMNECCGIRRVSDIKRQKVVSTSLSFEFPLVRWPISCTDLPTSLQFVPFHLFFYFRLLNLAAEVSQIIFLIKQNIHLDLIHDAFAISLTTAIFSTHFVSYEGWIILRSGVPAQNEPRPNRSCKWGAAAYRLSKWSQRSNARTNHTVVPEGWSAAVEGCRRRIAIHSTWKLCACIWPQLHYCYTDVVCHG